MLPLFWLELDAQGKKIIYTYAERCKYISELLIWEKTLKCVFQSLRDLSHFCQHSQLGNFTQTFCIFIMEKFVCVYVCVCGFGVGLGVWWVFWGVLFVGLGFVSEYV